MTATRRQFLGFTIKGMAYGLALGISSPLLSACSHRKFLNPDDDILVSGGEFRSSQFTRGALIVVNLQQKEKRVIDLNFVPFSLAVDPNDKYRLLCVEKGGTRAAIVDLANERVVSTIQIGDGQRFSGPAVYTGDGNHVYTLEYDEYNSAGFISERDALTMETSRRLPTLGLMPGQVQMQNTLVTISNTVGSEDGFHKPSLVSIDLETGKLQQRQHLPEATKSIDCFHQFAPGSFIICTHDNNGAAEVHLASNTKTRRMKMDDSLAKQLSGQASQILYMNGRALACYPASNMIIEINPGDMAVSNSLELQQPRAICPALEDSQFIASYGFNPAMVKLKLDGLEPVAESYVQPTYASSHNVLNWSVEIRRVMPAEVYN